MIDYYEKMENLYNSLKREGVKLLDKEGKSVEIINHANGLYSLNGDIITDYEIRGYNVLFIKADLYDYELWMVKGSVNA